MSEQYRKKPVVIEAEQYIEYGKLVRGMCNSSSCFSRVNSHPHVHTIHNNQIVELVVGDWIIPEPDGEHFYPCKPDIFEATYEKVSPSPPEAVGENKKKFKELVDKATSYLRQTDSQSCTCPMCLLLEECLAMVYPEFNRRSSPLSVVGEAEKVWEARPVDIKSGWKNNSKILAEIVTAINNEIFVEDEDAEMEKIDVVLEWMKARYDIKLKLSSPNTEKGSE